MTIKRGSTIFFSGSLTLIEEKLYLELQNFSFVRNNTSPTKEMPWSTQISEDISTPTSAARSLHNLNKKRSTMHHPISTLANIKSTTSIVDSVPEEIEENTFTPTPNPPTPTSGKRKTRSYKMQKLTTASDTISIIDSDPGEIEENESTPTPISTTPVSEKRKTRPYKTRKLATASKTTSIANLDPPEIEENAPAPKPTNKNQSAVSAKRKTRSSYKANNKMQKLADIASNIVSVVDLDPEVENEDF